MHVAAQNNQAYSLTFFRGILGDDSLADVDSGGMTPLHWACDHGSDIAILYLLSWISKTKQHSVINAQRADGQTALHLALIKAGQTGTVAAIKELLKYGAQREIKDTTGRRPQDYIGEVVFTASREQLFKIFVSSHLDHRVLE